MEKAVGSRTNKCAKWTRVLTYMLLFLSFLVAFGVLSVPHVQAEPGTHEITVVYYKVHIMDANVDWFQIESTWFFRLVAITPTGNHYTEWVGPWGFVDGETEVFGSGWLSPTYTWNFSGTAEYRVEAQEADFWASLIWDPDSLSTYTDRVNTWEYEDSVNEWVFERFHNTIVAEEHVIHYVKYNVSNLRPTMVVISGLASGLRGFHYNFTASGSDPEGDSVTYEWKVDDIILEGATEPTLSYAFPRIFEYGTHTISCRILDYFNASSAPVTKSFTIINRPPTVVGIGGPSSTAPDTTCDFFVINAYDPDDDPVVSYEWRINNHTLMATGPSMSVRTSDDSNNFTVSVRAMDSGGMVSEWVYMQVQVGVFAHEILPGVRSEALYAAVVVGAVATAIAIAGAIFMHGRTNQWPSNRTMLVAVGLIGLAAASSFVLFNGNPAGDGGSGGSPTLDNAVVATHNATWISSIFATLNGQVTSMGNASSVEVYFQWGESAGSLTHETSRQTMNSTGAFSTQITGPFMIGNTYYFRATGVNAEPGSLMSFYVP